MKSWFVLVSSIVACTYGYSTMSDSAACRNNCIGKGFFFCPGFDHTYGYCCSEGEQCPTEYNGICSN